VERCLHLTKITSDTDMAATAKSELSNKQPSLVDAFTSYGRDERKELLRQAEDLLCFSDRKIIKNEVRERERVCVCVCMRVKERSV
jgi:hypothetical protein